jgi:hypothetical protein
MIDRKLWQQFSRRGGDKPIPPSAACDRGSPQIASASGDRQGKRILCLKSSTSPRGALAHIGILRWVMVLIFISFGTQKFTPQSAESIAPYISNSPFVSWLSIFGIVAIRVR